MSAHSIEKMLLSYPDVIEVRVINRYEIIPGEVVRVFVSLRKTDRATIQNFCEWSQQEARTMHNWVEIHVLSGPPQAPTTSSTFRRIIALITPEEIWISLTPGEAPERKQGKSPQTLVPRMGASGNHNALRNGQIGPDVLIKWPLIS